MIYAAATILADLREVFGARDVMKTPEILAALSALPELIWSDIRGKPLDDRGLAGLLRQYEIKPKAMRFGAVTLRGYARVDLMDAWRRYLGPSPEEGETSATSQHEE